MTQLNAKITALKMIAVHHGIVPQDIFRAGFRHAGCWGNGDHIIEHKNGSRWFVDLTIGTITKDEHSG